ncbi:2Fe-2S iron-sulfur cluster-binding protein [Hydrogenophaga sp. 5NK40-0174]|uniref:2Fe-2S iron-sulfur cluster-binding protein n=1 Tax=Hydrogenophaga sp. 5NK40-0174 TaxID=3127649 RepID=UPI0031050ACA
MPSYNITIEDTRETYPCADERDLLKGMERLGKKGVPVGCRNGGCGICKVHIESGEFRTRVMSRAHVTAEEEQAGTVLACRAYPLSDVRLSVIGLMKKNVCRTNA